MATKSARKRSTKSLSLGQYLVSIGATYFCHTCFGYFYPGHRSHVRTAAFKPTHARLDGGLDQEVAS